MKSNNRKIGDRIVPRLQLTGAALSAAYFIALQCASPSTFWGTVFSFSMVWLALSVFFAVLAVLGKRGIHIRLAAAVKKLCAGITLFGAAVCAVSLYLILTPRIATGSESVKYVILLGGGITKDKKLSDMVQNRVRTAADYLQRQPTAKIVVTGGQSRFIPCPEAHVLKAALIKYGIDESRILTEDNALDTIQNFRYSARLIAEAEGVSVNDALLLPVAVVTSRFHLARSEYLASRVGLRDVYGVAAPVPFLFVPNLYCREIGAYVKLRLRIIFTGQPKTADNAWGERGNDTVKKQCPPKQKEA
jgi:Uncharacterized conserved protein